MSSGRSALGGGGRCKSVRSVSRGRSPARLRGLCGAVRGGVGVLGKSRVGWSGLHLHSGLSTAQLCINNFCGIPGADAAWRAGAHHCWGCRFVARRLFGVWEHTCQNCPPANGGPQLLPSAELLLRHRSLRCLARRRSASCCGQRLQRLRRQLKDLCKLLVKPPLINNTNPRTVDANEESGLGEGAQQAGRAADVLRRQGAPEPLAAIAACIGSFTSLSKHKRMVSRAAW